MSSITAQKMSTSIYEINRTPKITIFKLKLTFEIAILKVRLFIYGYNQIWFRNLEVCINEQLWRIYLLNTPDFNWWNQKVKALIDKLKFKNTRGLDRNGDIFFVNK